MGSEACVALNERLAISSAKTSKFEQEWRRAVSARGRREGSRLCMSLVGRGASYSHVKWSGHMYLGAQCHHRGVILAGGRLEQGNVVGGFAPFSSSVVKGLNTRASSPGCVVPPLYCPLRFSKFALFRTPQIHGTLFRRAN